MISATNQDEFQQPDTTGYEADYVADDSVNQANQPSLEQLFRLQRDEALPDGLARFTAINPFESFIVQAPAGSGKTALLTQRFLALLSQVDQPEQIVAMTFTKKAAAEMRDRVMGALKFGANPLPEEASLNDQNTWHLAQAALKQDNDQAWSLLQNPNRLRIKTIDGLNSYLVGQMPLLSKMGAQSQISHNVDAAYQEAVHLALKTPQLETAVGRLLGLVNGRFNRAETLLVSMLKKRDQWMGNLLKLNGDEARAALEASLQLIVRDELKQQVAQLSHLMPLLSEACEVAEYAVQNDQPELDTLCGAWPLTDALVHREAWQVLADWLLTKDSKGVRKTVTKNNGFPAGKGLAKDRKDQFLNILAGIREGAHAKEALEALAILKALPEPFYSDDQWLDLQWLIQLLKVSAGYLKVVFQSSGQADFIEVAQAASQALGEPLAPTDLAQQLDYQVKHLLVDEFQDTSSEQFKLIKKLIAGWQVGDARTLFIVGDPMQSIYRFREAEVGNFLKVWEQSASEMGELTLTPLSLKVNFRSTQGVVDWVNHHFKQVLPRTNQIEKGAVAYRDSIAYSKEATDAVTPHWAFNETAEVEALKILEVIQQRLSGFKAGDGKSIALLGRTRSSLMSIAHLLKQTGLPFRAVDLETLKDRQEVQDMLALSRALLHLSDRAAWIALLRSPFVGLSLNDLYAVMGERPYDAVWACLTPTVSKEDGDENTANLTDLFEPIWQASGVSDEGIKRLAYAIPILNNSLSRLGSLPFSTLVREAWIQLDGPQTVENKLALENVQVFCDTLAELDGESLDFNQLESMMESLFARADSSEASQRIELMTMHKSKGLEFDTVILPGLGRKPRGDESGLVSWFQFMDESTSTGEFEGAYSGESFDEYAGELSGERLVIAPITRIGQPTDRLAQLLKRFESEKQSYELGRLLYVAATRAKTCLHLFGQIKTKETESVEEEVSPVKDSMLSALWPCVSKAFNTLMNTHEFADEDEVEKNPPWPMVSRLPLDREGATALVSTVASTPTTTIKSTSLGSGSQERHEAECGSSNAETGEDTLFEVEVKEVKEVQETDHSPQALLNTTVGNLVHEILEQLVDEGVESVSEASIQTRLPFYEHWLIQKGLPSESVPEAIRRLQVSLKNALNNPTLMWALSSQFKASETEQELTSSEADGTINYHIVDRTFIDEQGVRWIIDYKTSIYEGALEGAGLEAFIAQKVAEYRPQLARYGALFDELDAPENRSQKWVLYFSYVDRWVELN
ncbi:MAG: UvrD-helicase domain-containing protein [Gammaproteobacteria bacterium]|nr:UvrD-helicase domain-containing protein [Gammaproteobacteria bacterium]